MHPFTSWVELSNAKKLDKMLTFPKDGTIFAAAPFSFGFCRPASHLIPFSLRGHFEVMDRGALLSSQKVTFKYHHPFNVTENK